MKAMTIKSAIKPYYSSAKTPLLPAAAASNFDGRVVFSSSVGQLKSVGLISKRMHVSCQLNRRDRSHDREQKREAKDRFNAVSEFHQEGGVIGRKSVGEILGVIYRYSRVYTIKGSVLSIVSICLLAVQRLADFTPSFGLGVLQAVIGGILANLYVVGLNQLSDIEIDKVNKPHLPLPSGDLPVKIGILITSLYAILGFCLGWSVNSWPLKLSLFFWFSIGSAYSVNLPLLRWKQYPVVVAVCAMSFQGIILPMLFHLHAQTLIHGRSLILSKHAIFVFGIMGMYTGVMSIFKDIPDVEGDKINGINSFASILGQKRVFWICIWLLEMVYAAAVLIGLSSTRFWIRMIMVIAHSILGFILWRKANSIDLQNTQAIESLYLFLWNVHLHEILLTDPPFKLYYAEYLLVPFLRF